MKVLLNHSQVKKLYKIFPEHIGILFSPQRTRFMEGKYPYALDNGAFAYHKNNQAFDDDLFVKVLKKSKQYSTPMFAVSPDVIGNHNSTLNLYKKWYPKIKELNIPVAFVTQDGCQKKDIPSDCDWVFIGGSNHHKDWIIRELNGYHKPVHCGRVNYFSRLWICYNNGITSVDGSGWFRGNQKQPEILLEYLEIASGAKDKPDNCLFNKCKYYV